MDRPNAGTFIDNLPEHLYHDRKHGFSSSDFKAILKASPYHFWYNYNQPSKPPTEAMRIGSVLHARVLRPEAIDEEVAVMPELNLRTNAGKEQKEQFLIDNKDKLVVTSKEFDIGMSMAMAVVENQEAQRLLEGGINERSMYGEYQGTPLRARADSYKINQLNELKSTRDGSPSGFAKQIANLQYHVSLVHYAMLLEQCVPEIESFKSMEFYFIVVENFEPYAVSTYKANDLMIDVAWEQWKKAANIIKECSESNEWYGYTAKDITPEISLPAWAIPYEDLFDEMD